MLLSLLRLLRIVTRDKPARLKPVVRYRATLDLAKVRPGMSREDVPAWLMKMGFTPTAKPEVWKTDEEKLSRLPPAAILKREKL
jgi:hypothetical protein